MSAGNKKRPCQHCGDLYRGSLGACGMCRRYLGLDVTEEHALPAGEWVLRGSIRVYIETPEVFTPSDTLGLTCHCGCLLVDEKETCPECFVWAIKNAEKWGAVDRVVTSPTYPPSRTLSDFAGTIKTAPESAPTPIRGLTQTNRSDRSEGSMESTYSHPQAAMSSEVA